MEDVLLGVGVFSFIGSVWYRRLKRVKHAICVLDASSGSVSGTIEMFDRGDRTEFVCKITGLSPPGSHGFHVHRCGDLRMGCKSACDHYNPNNRAHGGRCGPHRHKGDLGNIVANEDGVCNDRVVADVHLYEILGRALVIHADEDDLGRGSDEESKKTGNAGKRIGCGIVGRLD